MEDKRLKSI